MLTAVPQMQARGHTGYLLFARKLVPVAQLECNKECDTVGAEGTEEL